MCVKSFLVINGGTMYTYKDGQQWKIILSEREKGPQEVHFVHRSSSKWWHSIGGHFKAAFSGTGRETWWTCCNSFWLVKGGPAHTEMVKIERFKFFKQERGKEGHFIKRNDSNNWNHIVVDHFRATFSAREMRWPSKHSPIHTIYSISPFYWMKHYSICLKRVKRITNDIKCECKKSIFCNMILQGGLIFWYKICFH